MGADADIGIGPSDAPANDGQLGYNFGLWALILLLLHGSVTLSTKGLWIEDNFGSLLLLGCSALQVDVLTQLAGARCIAMLSGLAFRHIPALRAERIDGSEWVGWVDGWMGDGWMDIDGWMERIVDGEGAVTRQQPQRRPAIASATWCQRQQAIVACSMLALVGVVVLSVWSYLWLLCTLLLH
ncbi:unnamed protein product, partial [Effrenium voratum]